jgi:hypothetical protein
MGPTDAENAEHREAEARRRDYQRVLDNWIAQQRYFAEEDEFEYSTGFKERRHKTSLHRGRSDSDW